MSRFTTRTVRKPKRRAVSTKGHWRTRTSSSVTWFGAKAIPLVPMVRRGGGILSGMREDVGYVPRQANRPWWRF